MTKFRPCIDLHAGSVKQIVGGTLSTSTPSSLRTNWTSTHPAAYYASLYKQHNLTGAHVIMLGPGNETAAQEALQAWEGGMQVGGGINEGNAREWIERGAEKVRLLNCPSTRREGRQGQNTWLRSRACVQKRAEAERKSARLNCTEQNTADQPQ